MNEVNLAMTLVLVTTMNCRHDCCTNGYCQTDSMMLEMWVAAAAAAAAVATHSVLS
jgi:hypothetical protein